MKLMLIEDEYLLNKTIKTYLTSKDFEVDSYLNGLEALDNISDGFDLFIIDIDIPKITGIEILEHIRKIYPDIPVVIISATIDMEMITKAYTKGCNDYLKKPFDIKELELKINAFTRNISSEISLADKLTYNKNTQTIKYNDEIITLTTYENKFLTILIENRQKTVKHEYIESAIWGTQTPHLRQLVNRLRNKIPIDIIQNRIGEGYIIA
jgi:DNA-binding response OmpR family regulator